MWCVAFAPDVAVGRRRETECIRTRGLTEDKISRQLRSMWFTLIRFLSPTCGELFLSISARSWRLVFG